MGQLEGGESTPGKGEVEELTVLQEIWRTRKRNGGTGEKDKEEEWGDRREGGGGGGGGIDECSINITQLLVKNSLHNSVLFSKL